MSFFPASKNNRKRIKTGKKKSWLKSQCMGFQRLIMYHKHVVILFYDEVLNFSRFCYFFGTNINNDFLFPFIVKD